MPAQSDPTVAAFELWTREQLAEPVTIPEAARAIGVTGLSLETIARKVGYEHPNTLRVLLRERTGRTTSALRGSK